MDPNTIDPRLLMSISTPKDFENADATTAFHLGDFERNPLNDMDLGMANSSLMQPVYTDINAMESNLMDIGFMDYGSLELDDVTAASRAYGVFEGGPTDQFRTGTDAVDPDTMLDQDADIQMTDIQITDIDPLETYTTDDTRTRHHPADPSSFNQNAETFDVAGNSQWYSSAQTLQPPAQGQLGDATRENDASCHESNPFPSPRLPRKIHPAGLAVSKSITLDNRREYRPDRHDAAATTARITADDWRDYRPFIEQLYIIENQKLKDVMKILETKFEFVATRKMYNTKIKEWGFLKNYKAAEKEQLARIVKSHYDSGHAVSHLTLRNRPAKLDRIRRFCKQRKILEETCDALSFESISNTKPTSSIELSTGNRRVATVRPITAAPQGGKDSSLPAVPDSEKIWFNPERPFSTTSKDGRIELVLLQTKMYCESRRPAIELYGSEGASLQKGPERVEASSYVAEWRNKVSFGVRALVQHKFAEGWRLLNEACEMIYEILDQQSEALPRLLFDALSDNVWTQYTGLYTHLLRFFTKISATKLGCNHPMSIVLYHLQERQLFADAVRPAFEVLIDMSGESLDPEDSEAWLSSEYYCRVLIDRGDYAAAESHGLRSLRQSEEVFGRLHWRTRSFLHGIGRIHYSQGTHGLAEAEFEDVLQRGREDLGNEFPDMECINSFEMLAWIWEDRGDFARSEEHWRQALEGSIKVFGMENECTTSMVINLEASFKNQGRDPEAWLQQNFGISCI